MSSVGLKSKTKGCFQCSKRRIICDLGQPQCKKCAKKGIECSGLGRIRFVPGVASRGKLKNSRIPALQVAEQARKGNLSQTQRQDQEKPATSLPWPHASGGTVVLSHPSSIQPWLPPIGHHARMLLSHFSVSVAPVMVVSDNMKNGYREFILPLACHDELQQRTVGVVAAQHLSQSQPCLRAAAERGHKAIIDRLQRDAVSASSSVFSISTWITLIVLLVGATIEPGPSFGPLLRMLLLTAQNCETGSMPPELYDFLSQQTHMFEILARPQLNEQDGIKIISESLYHRLDWIPPDLDQNLAVEVSRQAFVETFQLYLRRANSHSAGYQSSVARLRLLVSQLDPNADGAHALVWPCFVGCIESASLDDRDFFYERLTQIFARTRFGNVQAAIKSLPQIWATKDKHTWTSNLADILPVLIM